MDVKGIAWVGHLYQKFETMCLEVEDIICQDTVKYVENQVETVGASVKRFYSDVMQDLLPPSPMDDEKAAVFNPVLDQLKNVVICKKPVKSMKIERPKSNEDKSSENLKLADDASKLSHDRHFDIPYTVSSGYSSNGSHVNGFAQKKCNKYIHHQEVKPPIEASGTNLTRENGNEASLCSAVLDRDCKATCGQVSKTATTLLDAEMASESAVRGSNEKEIEEVATDSEIDNLSSDVSAKSQGNNEDETRVLSCGDSSAEFDGSIKAWSLEEVNGDTICEHGTANIQQENEKNFDEACVLVNEDDFHFDSFEDAKCTIRKKKITRAFSFVKKSRKQEYKELAVKFGDGFSTVPNRQLKEPDLKLNEQKLETQDVPDHDWLLL